MTVGDRIKIARESIGMTQGELGKICGVTKQTIFKYENNIITNIPLDKLKLISSGLNVSAAKLMDWETEDGGIDLGIAQYETGLSVEEVESLIDTKNSPSTAKAAPVEFSDREQDHIKKYRLLDPYGKEAVDGVLDVESRRCEAERTEQQQVRAAVKEQKRQMEAGEEIAPDIIEMLVYVNPAAAGKPLYAESDFERLEFLADDVPCGADFGIRISGKSMEPTVMDGSIVWVRKRLDFLDGTVGVFMLNDSAVCKRFFKEGDKVRLESDNPDFDPVPITEFDTFVPVGEVIGTI